jgi:hypothetical protein
MSPRLFSIGGLVVKLAVAILHRTVSASPGFDSRPMQRAAVAILFVVLEVCCGGAGGPDSLIPSRRLQHPTSFLLLVISSTCLISLLHPRRDGILQASYDRKPSVSAH